MDENSISIIIPTINRMASIKKTLVSFTLYDSRYLEIVIVDQTEHDFGSGDIFLGDKKPNKIVYKHLETPSLTMARNYGLTCVLGDVVIFSDDDVLVNEMTIKNIELIMQDKSISMIAGINELEHKAKSKIGYILGFKSFFKRKKGHVAPGIFGRFPNVVGAEAETEWAMGFFFVVRKSLVEKWGLKWDEHFKSYAYAEDLDFSFSYYKKSKEEGYRCIMSNKVVVKHLQSQEYRIPSRQATFMYVLHRAYIYKKHNFPYRCWLAFKLTNYATLIKKRIKKENPRDMEDAIKYLKKHKKEVFSGNFYYGD